MTQTQFINLDNLKRDPLVVIEVGGKKHEMKTATVETFIENMKAIESLGLGASVVKEIEVMVGIIARSFPTLSEKEIRQWPIDVIQHLSEVARGMSGEVVTQDEEKAKEAEETGNDQQAT